MKLCFVFHSLPLLLCDDRAHHCHGRRDNDGRHHRCGSGLSHEASFDTQYEMLLRLQTDGAIIVNGPVPVERVRRIASRMITVRQRRLATT